MIIRNFNDDLYNYEKKYLISLIKNLQQLNNELKFELICERRKRYKTHVYKIEMKRLQRKLTRIYTTVYKVCKEYDYSDERAQWYVDFWRNL